MNATLITGASNGIGLEIAKVCAKNKQNLVLVARSLEKLQSLSKELSQQYGIKVFVIAKDLNISNAANEIFAETQKQEIFVENLVNNAGLGDFGMFHEADWKKLEQVINVNMFALTQLSHLYVSEMVKNKKGRILNIASTAAFLPGPLMAVYYATKAYVLSFSEAIANELKDKNVSVTVVCPGATESGFQQTANLTESKLVKNKKLPTSQEVAEFSYQSMMKGKVLAVKGFMDNMVGFLVRILPRSLVVSISRSAVEKSH